MVFPLACFRYDCTFFIISCQNRKILAQSLTSTIALGIYMTMFVIIITNILIALFGETLSSRKTTHHLMYNRAQLAIESSYDLPFGIFNGFVQFGFTTFSESFSKSLYSLLKSNKVTLDTVGYLVGPNRCGVSSL